MSTPNREQWSTHFGFLAAAVGSAVGLGNMWRFSYLASEHGGAAFLVLYIAMTVLIGLPVLLAELTIGRGAAKSPVQALLHFGGKSWSMVGWLFVVGSSLILSYYSVISGWTLRYAFESVFLGFAADPGARFGEIATGADAIAWHLGFTALTVVVVMAGVRNGIERASVILLPILGLLLVGIALYATTLDGGSAGYAQYLTPQFGQLLSIEVFRQAAGQAFFSLGVGMGVMMTYASYLPRDENLPQESTVIAGADVAVAFVAGLIVFPVIYALGLQGEVGGSAVGALFITLPEAFATMGMAGRVVGALFFVALAVAALTSAISVFEVIVSSGMDQLGVSRHAAALGAGGLIAFLGIPSALDLDILGLLDQVAGTLLLIVGSLAISVLVGWVMDDPVAEVSSGAPSVRWFPIWRFLLRYVAPAVMLVVLFFSLEPTWEAFKAVLQ